MGSAPGRADLLNTHQDYKGLPVVSAALSLRTRIYAEINSTGLYKIKSLALDLEDEFFPPKVGEKMQLKGKGWFGDYFRAVSQVLLTPRLHDESLGFNANVYSEVPVSSGLASSAALEVAFASLLNRVYSLGLDRKGLAESAYQAERDVMGIACGRLDQYGSALGGIAIIENKPPYRSQSISGQEINLIVVDSGIKHSTGLIHPLRQKEMQTALEELIQAGAQLPEKYYQVNWETLSEDYIRKYFASLSEISKKRILFTLSMQKSTEFALSVLKGNQALPNPPPGLETSGKNKIERLGMVMHYQHELLRDYYDVSTPELERIRQAMEASGAIGVKISGSGMGGSLIGLLPPGTNGKIVIDSALASGAKAGWITRIAGGEISRGTQNF